MHQGACGQRSCKAWSSPRGRAMGISDTVSGVALRRWRGIAAVRCVGVWPRASFGRQSLKVLQPQRLLLLPLYLLALQYCMQRWRYVDCLGMYSL